MCSVSFLYKKIPFEIVAGSLLGHHSLVPWRPTACGIARAELVEHRSNVGRHGPHGAKASFADDIGSEVRQRLRRTRLRPQIVGI
jgi:hypothetical protein